MTNREKQRPHYKLNFKKDIAKLKEPTDFVSLCKLAVEYSDGIIQQSENSSQEVLDYARSLGKPILEYQAGDGFAERCNNFYDQVAETEQSEQ